MSTATRNRMVFIVRPLLLPSVMTVRARSERQRSAELRWPQSSAIIRLLLRTLLTCSSMRLLLNKYHHRRGDNNRRRGRRKGSSACYQYVSVSPSTCPSHCFQFRLGARRGALYNHMPIITRRMTNRWADIGMPRITSQVKTVTHHTALYHRHEGTADLHFSLAGEFYY